MAIEQPRGRGFGVAEDEDAVRKRIARAVRRARLALLWERLWPKLVPPLLVAAVFLALSSLGVWIGMPEWLRLVVLGAFAVAAAAALAPLLWLRLPGRAAALARVERATGTPHRPAASVFDTLGAGTADPLTRAVWAAHRARILAEFGALKAGLPSPGVARRDPYAIRYLILLLAVVAFIAGGAGLSDRVSDAFRGGSATPAAAASTRVDAWAAPPDYTGRPPLFLTGDAMRGDGPIAVPAGTTIIVRTAAQETDIAVLRSADGAADTRVPPAASLGAGPREHRFVLDSDGGVTIRAGGETLFSWRFTIIPDTPPTIEWAGETAPNAQGALRIGVQLTDDYGIAAVRGEPALANPAAEGARPLVGPPEINLRPPQLTPGEPANVNAAIDVASHPWAGLLVDLRLVATDAVGQEGATSIRTFTLPQRRFSLPLSRALVEQRQILALDANQRGRVASALDLLTIAPDLFIGGAGEYLALRSVYYRLVYATDDSGLRAVVDALWNLAVALESNPVDNAGATLQAAADALREALEEGAPDEAVQALMDQLQAAVRQYLEELAQRAPTQADGTMPPPNADELDRAEIDEMIDAMRDMAANGNRDDAQEALDRLERMMENLRAGNTDRLQQQQAPPEGTEALQDLANIIVEQQRIQEETFAIQQQQNEPISTPRTDEEARQLLEELRQRRADQAQQLNQLQAEQQALGGALDRLMEEMESLGFLEPDNTLGAAREDMEEAATELGEGDPEAAVREQQEALVNLDGGARDLAQQILGNPNGQLRRSNAGTGGNDPLGRPLPTQGPNYGDETEVPEEIDRQRAREILDAIRQRLEDAGRPEVERNYLERLLEDF
ncbi:MAG: TIGR02302 family protein [Bauldia sp.]|nr:TIGR02302 family protein [Bauldia sp.]